MLHLDFDHAPNSESYYFLTFELKVTKHRKIYLKLLWLTFLFLGEFLYLHLN